MRIISKSILNVFFSYWNVYIFQEAFLLCFCDIASLKRRKKMYCKQKNPPDYTQSASIEYCLS